MRLPAMTLRIAQFSLVLLPLLWGSGCHCDLPRESIELAGLQAYPSCDDQDLGPGELIADRVLRSGSTMIEQSIVEHYEIRRHGCLTIVRVHQEWSLGITDLDLVYDSDLLPLRVWKRTALPDTAEEVSHIDTRVFELRGAHAEVSHRKVNGDLAHFRYRAERPRAVIGAGRGLLSLWIRRASLPVGGRLRELALDVRQNIEEILPVTLERLADREVEGLGPVRVYTIFGREPIYTDENNLVVGDLWGIRLNESLSTPRPPALPSAGPVDPMAPL